MSEDASQSRTVDGYTYTTAPVQAQLGPHRYAFPANLYDDQIGPSVGGGIALSFIWPGLKAAAPGDRPTRSMEDHYRTVTASIDYLDAVSASELLPRLSDTEATTEAGSINRNDPRRRLDLRKAGAEQFGLTPYAIDEGRMALFGKEYQKQFGEPVTRNPRKEDEWYIARAADGQLATFIKCDQPEGGNEGLAIQGDTLVPDESVKVSSCTHYFVDLTDNLGVTLFYPRVLLKDWKGMEEATRAALAKYKVQ
ncbi:hypothetical protein [Stenotrophomonas sp. ISL-67]|uniref:hypothetical protein n=1 Tax=Stenotrophomonas sp. ISL-67 TaxID=2819171 RepID=UPI002035BD0D|nr:hypothetical protein [Stenotrophomonas sp. ISL-67]